MQLIGSLFTEASPRVSLTGWVSRSPTYNYLVAPKSPGKPEPDQAQLEAEWYRIGLTAPARKALVEAKLYRVSDLRKITLQELVSIKGMSKSAVKRIQVIMDAKKILFATH